MIHVSGLQLPLSYTEEDLRRAAARLALAGLLLCFLPVFPGSALYLCHRDSVSSDLLIRRFSDRFNFPIQSDCIFI